MNSPTPPPGARGWQLFGPEMLPDPYPFYRQLRETDPIHWSSAVGGWVLTRFRDVSAALRDPRLAAERVGTLADLRAAGMEELAPLFGAMGNMMLFTDPPRH